MTTATSIIREDAACIVDDLAGLLSALQGATLLVTGASGFLCSHFLETIAVFNESARPGCRVLAVDNFAPACPTAFPGSASGATWNCASATPPNHSIPASASIGSSTAPASPRLRCIGSIRSLPTLGSYHVVAVKSKALAGLNGAYRETLESAVADADAAVLTTTDAAFRDADWARLSITMRTPVVIDGRNVLRRVSLPAKVRYYPIGKGPELAAAQTND